MSTTSNPEDKVRMSQTLARHTLVYGLGQVLTRLGSILLLPFYTHYLSPRDYGVIALVDIVVALLGVVVGSQAAAAATKHHFASDSPVDRGQVWWNAVWLLLVLDLIVVTPAIIGASGVAALTFGDQVEGGAMLIVLGLITLALSPLEQVGLAYLRAEKKSIAVIGLSFSRLVLNVAINLVLVGELEMGASGVLLGNLVTAVIFVLVTFAVSVAKLPFSLPRKQVAARLWTFGAPMFLTGILQLVMHESGRVALRMFGDIADVGVYGLAYQIGQGVNSLALMPFSMIFVPLAFEVAKKPDADWFFKKVFITYFGALALLMFSVSALTPELFAILIGEDFSGAAALLPLICLSFLVYGLHSHFCIPAMIHDRTRMLIPATVIASIVAIAVNFVLVPRYGIHGASFALFVSYSAYSFSGLYFYRRIRKIDYDFAEVGALVFLMIVTWVACVLWRSFTSGYWGSVVPVASVVFWTLVIAWRYRWWEIRSLLTGQGG